MVNDPDTPSEAIRVYAYLEMHHGWCRDGVLKIAAKLGMNPMRVHQALVLLKNRKLISCGKRVKYVATARKTTPYGDERWCPVPRDAIMRLNARDLRVLAMVGQARMRRVPDPSMDKMTAACRFWGGKPCRPSTVAASLRHLRKGGWMDHMGEAVTPYVPDDQIEPEEIQEDAVEPFEIDPWDLRPENVHDLVYGGPEPSVGVIPGAELVPLSGAPKRPKPQPDGAELFEQFWRAYPRRIAKIDARKAWIKALKGGAAADVIIEAAKVFTVTVRTREARFIPHPATWLNRGQWDDEPDPQHYTPSTGDQRGMQARMIADYYRQRGE
jgi:hypothetical protein